MAAVPLASDLPHFLALAATWTTAGTVLAAGPTAFVSNNTAPHERSQALALLRTGGDVGMLAGAVGSGFLAASISEPWTIMVNGGAYLGIVAFSGTRLFLRLKDATTP